MLGCYLGRHVGHVGLLEPEVPSFNDNIGEVLLVLSVHGAVDAHGSGRVSGLGDTGGVSNTWVGVISVIIAATSVIASILLELRRRAENRNAERARTAAELAKILEELGTAGLDRRLSATAAMAAHHNQLRQLHVAVRRNAAEYARTAVSQGMSATVLAIFAFEGTLILGFGLYASGNVWQIDRDQRWIGVLLVIGVCSVGALLMAIAFVGWARRADRHLRAKEAGVNVSGWRDELRILRSTPQIISARIAKRHETRRLIRLSAAGERLAADQEPE